MNIALLLSGGTGSRLGTDIPKQYIKVDGRSILSYCVETLASHPLIHGIHIVADDSWHDEILDGITTEKLRGFSVPGENRQLSVLHGLEDILDYGEEDDMVLIHDAARPMLSPRQITDCLEAAKGHDGAMPVLPMKDTVYSSVDGLKVEALLDRSRIFAGQAPEVFRLGAYYRANTRLLPDEILKIKGSTEPAVMAGLDIAMIPGDEGNFKITTMADLERFRQLIGKQSAGMPERSGR